MGTGISILECHWCHWSLKLPALRGESGQSLIIHVLALVTLMMSLAFSIDIGFDFATKGELQKSVDAAALAGAAMLPDDPTAAQQKAQAWATSNGIANPDTLTFVVTTTNVPNDTLTVQVNRPVTHQFANILGIESANVGAIASALIGSPAGLQQIIPFGVLQSAIAGLNHGDSLSLVYNSNDPAAGNSLAVSFPGNSGASDFRAAINNGASAPFCLTGQGTPTCPTSLQSEPGNMAGPARQGFSDLISTTGAACDTFAEVFQPDPSDPAKNQITPVCDPFPPYSVAGSKRIVILPVVQSLCQGSCSVPIQQFALFFVTGVHCTSGTCQVDGKYAKNVSNVKGYSVGAYSPNSPFNMVRLSQ